MKFYPTSDQAGTVIWDSTGKGYQFTGHGIYELNRQNTENPKIILQFEKVCEVIEERRFSEIYYETEGYTWEGEDGPIFENGLYTNCLKIDCFFDLKCLHQMLAKFLNKEIQMVFANI